MDTPPMDLMNAVVGVFGAAFVHRGGNWEGHFRSLRPARRILEQLDLALPHKSLGEHLSTEEKYLLKLYIFLHIEQISMFFYML